MEQVHGILVMTLLRMLQKTDNRKNNFLVLLGEGPIYGINGSFGLPEKKLTINFSKANKIFCLSLHYNKDNSSSVKWGHLACNGVGLFQIFNHVKTIIPFFKITKK